MGVPKIKSATKFRENLYETLKEVVEGETYIVTYKGEKNVVLISQDDFNQILDECDLLRSIAIGISDLEEGATLPHKKAVGHLRKIKGKWK
jgi:prevent-host-death family protein